MDINTIIYIAIFIIVVILIFKFIKKVIHAVITLILLFLLIIGGVGALIYSDINNLTSQNNYDVKFIYANLENYVLGVNLPIENQSLNFEKFSSIKKIDLNLIDVKKIDKDDNVFVIIVDREVFDDLLVQDNYDLSQLSGVETLAFKDYNMNLTKDELLLVMDSTDSVDSLANILMDKNKVSDLKQVGIEPVLEAHIRENLKENELSLKEAIFLYVLILSFDNEKSIINILDGYKEGTLEVYPERLSFKLVKFLPVSTVKSFLYDEKSNLSN